MAKKATGAKKVAAGHSLKLALPVSKEKVAAIQRCLAKGQLTITISQTSVAKGARAAGGYIYD